MARLPTGRQYICPGVYYTARPANGMSVSIQLTVRWYGYPLLAWKKVHEDYTFSWQAYPLMLLLIVKHSLLFWIKKDGMVEDAITRR